MDLEVYYHAAQDVWRGENPYYDPANRQDDNLTILTVYVYPPIFARSFLTFTRFRKVSSASCGSSSRPSPSNRFIGSASNCSAGDRVCFRGLSFTPSAPFTMGLKPISARGTRPLWKRRR